MNKKEVRLTLIHLIAYALLLIATPFLLLKNYLQTAIGKLSNASFDFLGYDTPYVVLPVILILSILIIKYKNLINVKRLKVITIVLGLLIIGQNSTDFYFNHSFFELQHNWHYLAYGVFSYFAFQFFKQRKLNEYKIILYTFFLAGTISIFDEAIQVPLSSRIFDICDIAKDLWGTIIGMTILLFLIDDIKIDSLNRKIRQAEIKQYISNPFTLLIQLGVFAYILLFVSSLLTDIQYLFIAVVTSILIYILIFLIIHYSQFKKPKIAFTIISVLIIISLVVSSVKSGNKRVQIINDYVVLYNGIPIPFFDIMIHNNGLPRVVDKKTFFNNRDQRTICEYAEDILLIGTSGDIKNIQGFPENSKAQFIYNHFTNSGLQVIILQAKESAEKYNNLKDKGLNVLYIIHQK